MNFSLHSSHSTEREASGRVSVIHESISVILLDAQLDSESTRNNSVTIGICSLCGKKQTGRPQPVK